jgi:hypothetical protein
VEKLSEGREAGQKSFVDFRLLNFPGERIDPIGSGAKHLAGLSPEQLAQSLLIGRLEFVEREICHNLGRVLFVRSTGWDCRLEIASTAIGDGCERCQGVPQPAFLDLGAISSL